MSTITEIIRAAERLDPDEFLKLRTSLDRIEERLWDQELGRAGVRHRKAKLTDAKIDELVLKRRYRGKLRKQLAKGGQKAPIYPTNRRHSRSSEVSRKIV